MLCGGEWLEEGEEGGYEGGRRERRFRGGTERRRGDRGEGEAVRQIGRGGEKWRRRKGDVASSGIGLFRVLLPPLPHSDRATAGAL